MNEYDAQLSEDVYEAAAATAVEVNIIYGEHYEGIYQVTPSREEQVLQTAGLVMDEPVVIAAIPREYGLVTYDGRGLRVS